MGAMFGRHLVVRGMFSLEETRAQAFRVGEQFFGSGRFPPGHQGGAPGETARPAEPLGDDARAATEAGRLAAADAQRLEDAARKAQARDLAGLHALLAPLAG